MKAVILNFTGRRENWGCQATSFNLFRFVDAVLKPFGLKQLDIVPFPPGGLLDKMEQFRFGERLRSVYAASNPDEADLRWLEARVTTRFGDMVERVRTADIVFFQGEGAIGPSRFFRSTLLFGLPVVAARFWGKPVISLNQTVFAEDQVDDDVLVNILKGFSLNAVREAASSDWCAKHGLEDVLVHPDLAFCDMFNQKPSKSEKPYFCVTGSAALEAYDLAEYSSHIGELAKNSGLAVKALSSRSQEQPLLENLRAVLGENLSILSSEKAPNYQDILTDLAGARFVLGGRYHTSISALAQGTPIILTPSNSHKSQGLADLLGLKLPVVRPGDHAGLMDAGTEICDSAHDVRQDVEAALGRVEQLLEGFRTTLAEAVSEIVGKSVEPKTVPSLRNSFAHDGIDWTHSGVPKGGAKVMSQLIRSRNLDAFDWKGNQR